MRASDRIFRTTVLEDYLHGFLVALGSERHICPACESVLVVVQGLAVPDEHEL